MGSKKRKRQSSPPPTQGVDTSKPTAIFRATHGRQYTLSVALPGSIIANAQTHELQAQLAGQIARALAVFCVDEVVIFDDGQTAKSKTTNSSIAEPKFQSQNEYTGFSDPQYFLAHVLSYLECPPYLRKNLFSMHPDLRLAGLLPSLDMPHHLRRHDWCQYREGIVEAQEKNHRKKGYTLVQTGLKQEIFVKDDIPVNSRVTVKFESEAAPELEGQNSLPAEAVAPTAPREESGYYWGYTVRSAASLSTVLTECPFDGGYDLTFGTSERGMTLAELTSPNSASHGEVPRFNHMLIALGGVSGLEVAVQADDALQGMGVTKPEELFDYWVNLVPGQGSRTIRTEEALWLALLGLRDIVLLKGVGQPR